MKRNISLGGVASVLLMAWSVSAVAQSAISANGVVESKSGGFKFPDGTVQATAAVDGAPVEDTGLDAMQCFDVTGTSRNCIGTGEDGELQAGVDWPTPRFTDNGDGTVTDNLTGLIWLKDANCPAGEITWQAALDWVVSLNTTSISCTDYAAMTFDDWRLPNIKELLSLVDYGHSEPALTPGHPFVNVNPSGWFWSSSTKISDPARSWDVAIRDGTGTFDRKTDSYLVWPVRGGK